MSINLPKFAHAATGKKVCPRWDGEAPFNSLGGALVV